MLFVPPGLHVAARLLAAVLASGLDRQQGPRRRFYNVGAAALEVGMTAFAVGLVPPDAPGPATWAALYLGLLVADVAASLALNGIWRLMGLHVELRRTLRTLLSTAPASLLFTGLAIVAISAVQVEYLTAVVMVGAVGLVCSPPTGRTAVWWSSSRRTERLYRFVKDLGPVSVDSVAAVGALDQVRQLLHAERLELARACTRTDWQRLVVAEGQPPRRVRDGVSPLVDHVAATRHATLRGAGGRRRGHDGHAAARRTPGSSASSPHRSAWAESGGFEPDDLHHAGDRGR